MTPLQFKLIKFSRKQIRNFHLFVGFGGLALSVEAIIAVLINLEQLILFLLVFLLAPNVLVFLDGFANRFTLKKVELFKIFIGLFMEVYTIIFVFLFVAGDLIELSLITYLIAFLLLIMGFVKVIIGIVNIEYIQWYRRLLILSGTLIISLATFLIFLANMGIIYLGMTVSMVLIIECIVNITYGIKKNIEIENFVISS